jgi:hypothetical protein
MPIGDCRCPRPAPVRSRCAARCRRPGVAPSTRGVDGWTVGCVAPSASCQRCRVHEVASEHTVERRPTLSHEAAVPAPSGTGSRDQTGQPADQSRSTNAPSCRSEPPPVILEAGLPGSDGCQGGELTVVGVFVLDGWHVADGRAGGNPLTLSPPMGDARDCAGQMRATQPVRAAAIGATARTSKPQAWPDLGPTAMNKKPPTRVR